jgi:riboflavin synthase
MFTGLIEEVGAVARLSKRPDGCDLTIRARIALDALKQGDSIAIDGVCLTVTAFDKETFTVGLSPETLRRTALGELKEGAAVNLERAVLPTTRLGGHYVQGHIDGAGVILRSWREGDSLWLRIGAPEELMRYVAPKGFIAVDGASLTVAKIGEDSFDVMLVAYSQDKLALSRKAAGARVNLETDVIAKYVERLLFAGAERKDRGFHEAAASYDEDGARL